MDELVLFYGLPTLCTAGITWYYSRAMFKGIASARDPNHRVTPASPWFFFFREFKPRAIRVAIVFLPAHEFSYRIFALDFMAGHYLRNFDGHPSVPLLYMTGSFSALALSTLIAPRLNAWSLSFYSSTLAVAISCILFLWMSDLVPNWRWLTIHWPKFVFQWILRVAIPFLLALGAFVGSWWWVRRKGEAWFRFEE